MLYVIYRPRSEHARSVEEFERHLQRRNLSIELVDADTRDGAAKMQTYGIMQYPTVLATRDDGQLLKMWEGIIPTIADVEFYARSSI